MLAGARLERARDLLGTITLDDIADFEIVEVLYADAALESFAHLAHVFLEASKRRDRAVVDFDALSNDASPSLAIDDPTANRAPSDRTETRDLENLANLGLSADDLTLLGSEQTFERRAHVVHRLVNDPIETNVNAFSLGRRSRVVIGPDMESKDDGARRFSEQNIALGDCTDASMHDLDFYLGVRQLHQCVSQSLSGSALVSLDENAKGALLARGRLRHEVFQRDSATRCASTLRLTIEALASLSNIPCRGGILDDEELVSRHRHALHAEHLRGNRRSSGLHRFSA